MQETPSILCDKLQHEIRKPYGPSVVGMRLQLLCKQRNNGTSTRIAKFTWHDVGEFVILIMLFRFVCLSVGNVV